MNKTIGFLAVMVLVGCGNPADQAGIAAKCSTTSDCAKVGDKQLACLTGFKGGYCGLSGCTKDEDCVTGSLCVKENGTNYCFRACTDKAECNVNRTADSEANCSSNIDRVGTSTAKACVPPSA